MATEAKVSVPSKVVTTPEPKGQVVACKHNVNGQCLARRNCVELVARTKHATNPLTIQGRGIAKRIVDAGASKAIPTSDGKKELCGLNVSVEEAIRRPSKGCTGFYPKN